MSFENIIGQHRAIRAIENIISQGQLRGSYLFLGPDGVGKRTVALELAKAINCEAPLETKDTCSCASCKKITSGNHPDVFLISPEGASYSIKIAKVRDIIYQASLKPYEGKKRVFIIDDALEMTEEAQNALLKVLEEPPERHIFILVASKVAGFLPTVISRCRILKFHPVKQSEIQDFLKNRDVDEDGAVLFSHMAMGSIGRALEYIEGDIIPRREQVVNDFFLRKSVLLRESSLNENVSDDVEESLFMLLCWYRDLLVANFTDEKDLLLNIDRSEEISSYANRFSKLKLEKDISAIIKTINYVRSNINPKIALFEMAKELQKKC